jgi:hypothetical protein
MRLGGRIRPAFAQTLAESADTRNDEQGVSR